MRGSGTGRKPRRGGKGRRKAAASREAGGPSKNSTGLFQRPSHQIIWAPAAAASGLLAQRAASPQEELHRHLLAAYGASPSLPQHPTSRPLAPPFSSPLTLSGSAQANPAATPHRLQQRRHRRRFSCLRLLCLARAPHSFAARHSVGAPLLPSCGSVER